MNGIFINESLLYADSLQSRIDYETTRHRHVKRPSSLRLNLCGTSLLLKVVILLHFAAVSHICMVVRLFAFLCDNFASFCGHFASPCGCYTSFDSGFARLLHFFGIPLHLLVVKLCPFVFFFYCLFYVSFASVRGCNAPFYGCLASLHFLVATLHLFVVVSVLFG